MASEKFVTKTMPYSKSGLKAAEDWLENEGGAMCIDPEDFDAIAESLARAFQEFAEGVRR